MLALVQQALQVTCKHSYTLGSSKVEIKETCGKAPKCVKFETQRSDYGEIKGSSCPVGATTFDCQQLSGMHCKSVNDGFKVKTHTKTTIGSASTEADTEPIYYSVALFGDRTDAIILLITTLLFGSIMLVLLFMQCGCCKCCKSKKGSSKMH